MKAIVKSMCVQRGLSFWNYPQLRYSTIGEGGSSRRSSSSSCGERIETRLRSLRHRAWSRYGQRRALAYSTGARGRPGHSRIPCPEAVLLPLLVAIALTSSAVAGSVTVMEKYARSPDMGVYATAPHGQALGVAGRELIYPVVFNKRQVTKGAILVCFKPLLHKRDWRKLHVPLVTLTDGSQNLRLRIYPFWQRKDDVPFTQRIGISIQNPAVPRETWQFGHNLGSESHTIFHHLVYTWDRQKAYAFLDGEQIAAIEKKDERWLTAFDGSAAQLILRGNAWFDEVAILDRAITAAQAHKWSQDPSGLGAMAAFRAEFSGSLAARCPVGGSGDVVRFVAHVGHPDATFRRDEPTQFTFTVVNTTGVDHKLSLRGLIKDLHKKTVLNKAYPVQVGAGGTAQVLFDLAGIKPNGLFWGYFSLTEKGEVIQKETIQFAKTLAVDVTKYRGDEIGTGICEGRSTMGFNPPVYEKWHQVHYEFWRDMEMDPGKWYFDRMDLRIDNLVRTGRIPVVLLYGSPDWQVKRYPVGEYKSHMRASSPPDDLDAWKAYVRTLGERYKGKVKDYLVWTCEAFFLGSNFRGTTAQYVELVKTSAEILHAIDPEIRVVPAYGGYDRHAMGVAKGTAGLAAYYTSSHYKLFDRKVAYPERIWDKQRSMLKATGASTKIANMEFGVYALGRWALHEDGYPMTRKEFEEAGIWAKMPDVYRRRGQPFPDWHTVAALVVRGVACGKAAGLLYNLYWSTGNIGSFSELLYKAHAPSPASVAYANISGLLAGAKYRQRINIGSPELKAYLFQKDDEHLIITFTDKQESPAYFEVAGDGIRVLDLYGNDSPYESFGPVMKVMLQPNRPLYVTGISRVPEESRPVLDTSSTGRASPGMKASWQVSLYNPLPEPVTGTVEVELPKSFASMAPQEVTLAPKETKDVAFTAAVPMAAIGTQTMVTRFATRSEILKTLTHQGTFQISPAVVAPRVQQPPKIDGKLDEWGDVTQFPIRLDRPAQLLRGVPYTQIGWPRFDWNGTHDLSALATVAHDAGNLYVAIRAFDDKLKNLWYRSPVPQRAYDGDSVELLIDGRGAKDQGGPTFTGDAYHLIIVPPMKDYPSRWYRVQKPQRGALVGLVVESLLLKDGYTMEIKLPFRNFLSLKAGPGLNIGLDLGVNDHDEYYDTRKAAKAALRWTGCSSSGNPSLFGRLILR